MSQSGEHTQDRGEGEMPPPPHKIPSTTTESATSKRQGGKPPSDVWLHFTKFNKDGEEKAKCNYCPKEYFCHSKRNGTSSLKSHMATCQKRPLSSSDTRQTQLDLQPISEEGEGETEGRVVGNLSTWKFDQQFCRLKLVEMIIKDELPFKIVEGEGFKEFVAALQTKFKLPSRWTIGRDIYRLFHSEKEKLRAYFKNSGQSVSITTDTWTSVQNINYMCITAHYIDDGWKLRKKIINFCTIESRKGLEMGRQIDGLLKEWGIKRVFSVTVDNASSNNTCVGSLRTRLNARGACLVEGKYLHMRCVAHIVNLVVQDGLKDLDLSIKKIRDAVRFVRLSPARLARFKECCKDEEIDSNSLLCLDVPTRWNSTYLMLQVACKFEKAFELFEVRDLLFKTDLDNGPPDFDDWENARKLSKVLQLFYDLTNRVSGSLYVTSNVFFHEITNMSCLLKEWVANSAMDVRSMGMKMKDKFDKYWGDPKNMNKIIFFGIVIDPRYKFEVLSFILVGEYGEEVGSFIAKSVKNELYALLEVYKGLLQAKSGTTSSSQVPQSSEKLSSTSSSPYVYVERYLKKQKNLDGDDSNDLDMYLTEKYRSQTDDILNWWKINQPRLPILAQLARDILSVPISTVASESAFSTGGRILDPFRSSLTPRIVESLVCTQDWLRKSKQPISLEEDLDSIQKHEEALVSLGICGDKDDDVMELDT